MTQSLVNRLAKDWKSFFALKKSKVVARCNIPKYKQKYNGLQFNKQTISKPYFEKGLLKTYLFSVNIPKFITFDMVQSVDLQVDTHNVVTLTLIYNEKEPKKISNTHNVIAGLDLGLSQLATITFNDFYQPISYSGKPILELSHNYARCLAKATYNNNVGLSHKLWSNRRRKMDHLMHIYSSQIVRDLLDRRVCKLIIGYNEGWKHEVNLGRRVNQKFYAIPHLDFINKLAYKLESVGILVERVEESYTSKSSFMDNDLLPVYGDRSVRFSGKRVQRGMYRHSGGYIHADVNGSYNILRKAGIDLSNVQEWLRGHTVIVPVGKSLHYN